MTLDLSALWVVFFLLLCSTLLNTLVFKPILDITDRRARAVRDARELAESASHKAESARADYERTLNAARADIYNQIDETRRVAMDARAARLAETRAAVETELRAASERVQKESADAKSAIDREAAALAGAIVTRVLGRAS
jgi:F0F1-type ATP synthase membrane subunit b/b'